MAGFLQLRPFKVRLKSTRALLICALVASCLPLFAWLRLRKEEHQKPGTDHLKWRLFGERQIATSREYESTKNRPTARTPEALSLACQPGDEGILGGNKYSKLLEALESYAAFHSAEEDEESTPRVLKWECPVYDYCGGLADRIKGISFSLLVAMITKRRLIIGWPSHEFGEHSFLQANKIEWADSLESDYDYYQEHLYFRFFAILEGTGVDQNTSYVKSALEYLVGDVSTVILSTNLEPSALNNRIKTGDVTPITRGMAELGLAQMTTEDVDAIVGIVFRFLFKFHDFLLVEVDRARGALGLQRNERYVAVHIRSGFAGAPNNAFDTSNHPKLMHRAEDWEKTLECALKTSDWLLGTSSLLFLATDSFLIKQMAITKYGGRIRTLNNSLIHIDKLLKYPHTPDRKEVEGYFSMWVEFVLLAEAFAHVRGDSGLPFLAGHVCGLPPTRTISGLKCEPLYRALDQMGHR